MKNLDYYKGLNYRMEIVKDPDGEGYLLYCPDLNGCMTCAASIADGIKQLEDAKSAWLEAALEEGMEIPEPLQTEQYSGQFKLRMPKSLHKRLAEQAREEGISMNQYCVYKLSR